MGSISPNSTKLIQTPKQAKSSERKRRAKQGVWPKIARVTHPATRYETGPVKTSQGLMQDKRSEALFKKTIEPGIDPMEMTERIEYAQLYHTGWPEARAKPRSGMAARSCGSAASCKMGRKSLYCRWAGVSETITFQALPGAPEETR
jgi:hypothetical protein